MFKVNKTMLICSKLRRQWRRFGIFVVNFEHILHLVLVFLLLTLSRYMPAGIRVSDLFDNLLKFWRFYNDTGRNIV